MTCFRESFGSSETTRIFAGPHRSQFLDVSELQSSSSSLVVDTRVTETILQRTFIHDESTSVSSVDLAQRRDRSCKLNVRMTQEITCLTRRLEFRIFLYRRRRHTGGVREKTFPLVQTKLMTQMLVAGLSRS